MVIDNRDKTLVMVTVVFWAIMFLILLGVRPADARVTLAEPAAFSIGADDCSMFADGCQFAQGLSGVSNREAIAEDSYYKTIKDGVAMGIDAFGLDMQSNTTQATWVLARLSAAMKKYNGENATAKKCIFVSYRNAGGEALAMFNAADSNNSSDSPYCAVDGKPLVGVKQTSACVNPLPGLTGKGPFVVLGTMSGATDGVPTKACVDAWKANNASRAISYPDAGMTTPASAKATATGTGADYAVGVPSTWARQCGGADCLGSAATNYTMRDGYGFLAAVTAMKAALADRSNVVFPYAFPGNYAEDVSWERARICDSNDTVAKSGFTCPNVPDRLRGTIPTGNAGKSNSNKSFMKAGLHRVGQWFNEQRRATADPASRPFISWAYREHPLALSSNTFDICPSATAGVDAARSFAPTTDPPPPPPSGQYDLALEFDNRSNGTYTNAMQVEDSGGRAVENFTGGIYTSPITIVDNGEGGKALRVGVGPQCQQASHRPTGLTPGKEYIFETRLRFAPNFVSAQNDGGGKVFFGIQGGVNNTYNPSANDTSGSTLVMYAGKNRLRDYTYDQTRSCVGSPSCWGKVYHNFGSKATGWHTIKVRTKLNTPGKANGILQYWYDGVKTFEKNDMLWIKAGIDWSWYKARFTTTIGGPCEVNGTNRFSEASYVDYDYFRYQRIN